MNQDELEKVEAPAIAQLQALGWHYTPGAALAPEGGRERAYYADAMLPTRFEAAVRRINPWISDENLRKVVREFTHPAFATTMESNQHLWQLITSYMSVEQDLGKGRKGQTVKVIDFDNLDNNEFLCTSQFKVEGPKQAIFPDIVLFVNGLPLAVIECKRPYQTNPIAEAINQLRRYANLRQPHTDEGAEKLFWYNQVMVATCRDRARVGTISSTGQHYGEWKDAYPLSDDDLAGPEGGEVTAQQRLIAGLFSRANFLDILQNFIVFETVDGRMIKKVARYQQFRAVNKVIERLKTGADRKAKSGIVWHTQGSGKSLTMVMLAVKIRRDPELKSYKLVFITDRTQLDGQLSETFTGAQAETVLRATSVAKLREYLATDSSDLVTTTVQKFQDAEAEGSFKDLNPSDRIIVLADEAHRTQFGGLAVTINNALPNAPKIGFTGTPLLKSQKKMDTAFGGYIDQYKINEAVEDGATVRLLYEGREVKLQVADQPLDSLFDEYFADRTEEEKREIKRKYGVERAVQEAPQRVKRICMDILKHYREHIQPDGFKAMIVTGSRHAAVLYKEMLDELGAPPSEVVISGDHNDEQRLAQYTDKARQKTIISDFPKPLSENPVAFLIVKDMLLTGFDAPIAQVMYIDRQLKEHTLMQAIARVNRTYKGKACGYIVDYYGLAQHLSDALDMFSSDDIDGAWQSLKDEVPKLKATHTNAMAFFRDVKGNDVDDYVLALKEETVRARFSEAFKKFARQMNIVLPDRSAAPFLADLRLLGKVNFEARRKFRDEQLSIEDAGAKVRQIVDDHILSTGVDPKIPPVDLLAADYKTQLQGMRSVESKASEIESALKHHITVHLEEDPAYYHSLGLRLRDIILRTAGRWEDQVQMLLELRATIETERKEVASKLGLNDTEFAFYNTLVEEVAKRRDSDVLPGELHDEILSVTKALVEMLNEATAIVDFFTKQDEVRRMQQSIKRAIVASSFDDPELRRVIMDKFTDLARVRFRA